MRILILAIFTFGAIQVKCQDSIDRKYLVSLLYLKSNKDIINKIKQTFFNSGTSNDSIEFVIHNELWFHPLYSFNFYLKQNNWGIDTTIIENKKIFYEKYYFEPISVPLISKLLPSTNPKILLTFSRPFENCLIAEILDRRRNSTNQLKTGKAMEILFIFDENDLIKKVFTISPYYR
jgi:hypothetical protein